jgi:hypothetical protein
LEVTNDIKGLGGSFTDDYKSLQNSVMSMREDIKDCIESIKLKRNESDNNTESGPVPEVVSSSLKPDQPEEKKRQKSSLYAETLR